MNKHVKAMLIKFVGSLALLYIILGLMYEMTFGQVLLLTVILGVVSYIGDMLVLPRVNNTVATIADLALAWAIIYWFANSMTVSNNLFTATLIAAVGISLFEMFFHRYLVNNVFPDKTSSAKTSNLQYQTEISDELGEIQEDNKSKENMDK